MHSAWIVSPVLVLAAFIRGPKWRWIAAALVSVAAAIYDPNPMFWASSGCGVLLLASCIGREFIGAWVTLFFAGALVVFFAGSARYLLPIAAPVAILAARACSARTLALGFALQMPISLGLAVVNYQHWNAYREFASSLSSGIAQRRTWINGDWGLRFYLESEGALPMPKNQAFQPGDMVVTSELASLPITVALWCNSPNSRSGRRFRCASSQSTGTRRIRWHRPAEYCLSSSQPHRSIAYEPRSS